VGFGETTERFYEGGAAPASSGASSRLAPPPGVRIGDVAFAKSIAGSPWGESATGVPPTKAQLAGLRYERKVQEKLAQFFQNEYRPGPWFKYQFEGAKTPLLGQPDGVWEMKNSVVVVEIKIRWCAEAWWKLKRVYAPVVERALSKPVRGLLCVTRSFDPAIRVPDPVQLFDEPIPFLRLSTDPPVTVLLWKGRKADPFPFLM
jgi:hypothetical protein